MIELRWITRGVEYYAINEGHPARYVKVLQYRQTVQSSEGDLSLGGWLDVPDRNDYTPSGCPCVRLGAPLCHPHCWHFGHHNDICKNCGEGKRAEPSPEDTRERSK